MKHLPVVLLGLLALAALLCLPAPVRSAATFTVNSTADVVDANPGDGVCDDGASDCTLRAAIQETNALAGPDTINLPAGTYTLSIPGKHEDAAATGDLDITGDLTITGAGQDVTVIDGGEIDRVFHVWELPGQPVTVEMAGVTIRNGNSEFSGGGILNGSGASLTLTDSIVMGNTATRAYGGGICVFVGDLTLANVTVSGNTAPWGGGIYNDDGTLTVANSTVNGNTAGAAGGLANGGTLTLTESVITGNSASHGGGLINFGDATLTSVTLSSNTASFGAGGIDNGGMLTLTNSTVADNAAPQGAGIFGSWEATATFDNVTISGNTASDFGGGIRVIGPVMTPAMSKDGAVSASRAGNERGAITSGMTLTNVTISGNTAPLGSAILNDHGTVTVTNSTISENSSPEGGCIFNGAVWGEGGPGPTTLNNTILAWNGPGDNCFGPITSGGHNLEDADTCGLAGPEDIVNADPLLGPLADNGGATQTHALLTGSPAIDAGDDSGCPETDQRGIVRPVDGDGDGVAVCDIGAYEAPASTTTPTPTPTPPATPTPVITPTPTPTAVLEVAQLPATGGEPPGEGAAGTLAAAVAAVFITGIAGIAGLLALRRQGRRDE